MHRMDLDRWRATKECGVGEDIINFAGLYYTNPAADYDYNNTNERRATN
jgi:hypothetical protein